VTTTRTPVTARGPVAAKATGAPARAPVIPRAIDRERNAQQQVGNQAVLRSMNQVLGRAGHPLDPGTRSFMERGFGRDFGGVRLHTDDEGARSAGDIDAKAYTVGDRIVFGAGHYAPGTAPGRHLLAHELAHTVQQGGLQMRSIGPSLLSTAGDALERDADAGAAAVMRGGPVPVLERATTPTIARAALDAAEPQPAPPAPSPEYPPRVPKALAEKLRSMKGYRLVCAILHEDLVTGAPLPADDRAIMRELFVVLGQAQVFEELDKRGEIVRLLNEIRPRYHALKLPQFVDALLAQATVARNADYSIPSLVTLGSLLVDKAGEIGTFLDELRPIVKDFIVGALLAAVGPLGVRLKRIMDNAGALKEEISADPMKFLGYVVEALGRGFQRFRDHLGTHLLTGVKVWLGKLFKERGIPVPTGEWTIVDMAKMAVGVMGLTWQRIRPKLVANPKVGEAKVQAMERIGGKIYELFENREMIAEQVATTVKDLREDFFGTILGWLTVQIIEKGLAKLALMLVPAGGAVAAVLGFIDLVKTIADKIDDLLTLVEGGLVALGDVVHGKLDGAAEAFEKLLGLAVPFVIHLATVLIGWDAQKAINGLIDKIRTQLDPTIDKILDWLVDKADELIARLAKAFGKDRFLETALDEDGEAHRVWIDVEGDRPTPMMASSEQKVKQHLEQLKGDSRFKDKARQDQLAVAMKALELYVKVIDASGLDKEVKKLKKEAEKSAKQAKAASGDPPPSLVSQLDPKDFQPLADAEAAFVAALRVLFLNINLKSKQEAYTYEGLVGTWASLPKMTKDRITPDHQPQHALYDRAAKLRLGPNTPLFGPNSNMVKRTSNRSANAQAINLHEVRHALGRTFQNKGKATVEAGEELMSLIMTRNLSPARKRAEVVEVLKQARKLDIEAMLGVLKQEDAWDDIEKLIKMPSNVTPAERTATEKAREKLKELQTERIEQGETKMKNMSDLDELTSE
jgi:Domain of unknown function (DUF4157)